MYKEQGLKKKKMKVGLGIEKDLEHVKAVREAIGMDIGLMIDANHAFDLREAKELIRSLKDLNIKWLRNNIRLVEQVSFPGAEEDRFDRLASAAGERQIPRQPEVAVVSAGGGPIAGCMLLTR